MGSTAQGEDSSNNSIISNNKNIHAVSTTYRLTEASNITATDMMSMVAGTDTPTVTYSVAFSPPVPEIHIIT